MQNERWYGELPWLGAQPATGESKVPKFTHTESAGQLPGSRQTSPSSIRPLQSSSRKLQTSVDRVHTGSPSRR